MSTGTSSLAARRALQAAIGIAAATGIGSVAAWLPLFLRNLARGITSGILGGNDFAMYYTAAVLGRAGRWADAYSLEGLADAMGLRVGAASFAYPPVLAQWLSPLTLTEYPLALAAWFTASALIIMLAVPLVLGRTGVLGVAAMAFPVYVALRFGQFAPFAIGAMLLFTVAMRRDRRFLAGAALGLLVLKPQLLIGPALIALLDREARAVLRGMVASAGSILAVSCALEPAAWGAFVTGLGETAQPNVSSSWDYSILGLLDQLPTPLLVVAYVTLAGLLVWLSWRASRATPHLEVKMGLGVALSIALSPRMIIYDWSLLAIVGAWILPRFASSSRLRWACAGVIVASLSGHSLSPVNVGWPVLATAIVGFTTSLVPVSRSDVSDAERRRFI